MKLFESYSDVVIKEFWDKLNEITLVENTPGLNNLLSKANKLVFEKFNINPSDKVYFIAGSARLYLSPELRQQFNLGDDIGDLDIIIPNKELWLKAGLNEELKNGGIYRPTSDGSIEVFDVWDPNRGGVEYAKFNVRSTDEILKDATFHDGYFYMSLADIVQYKTNLSRSKEKDVVELFNAFYHGHDKNQILRQIVKILGFAGAKQFLGGK